MQQSPHSVPYEPLAHRAYRANFNSAYTYRSTPRLASLLPARSSRIGIIICVPRNSALLRRVENVKRWSRSPGIRLMRKPQEATARENTMTRRRSKAYTRNLSVYAGGGGCPFNPTARRTSPLCGQEMAPGRERLLLKLLIYLCSSRAKNSRCKVCGAYIYMDTSVCIRGGSGGDKFYNRRVVFTAVFHVGFEIYSVYQEIFLPDRPGKYSGRGDSSPR